MPYCPKCLTEYVEGTARCEDCQAQLMPGSPPVRMPVQSIPGDRWQGMGKLLRSLVGAEGPDKDPQVKTVRVRSFSGPTAMLDAQLARNVLETQGIPTILPGEASLELMPFLEVSLLVSEDDLPRATQILKDYFDSSRPSIVEANTDDSSSGSH